MSKSIGTPSTHFDSLLEIERPGADDMDNKITAMENKISQLEEQNKELQRQVDYNRNKEAALQKVLCNYDNFLKKVIMEKNVVCDHEQTIVHLANLESAFNELLQKYEKAKVVVQGFQQNETLLKKQVTDYEEILESLRVKFATYKSLSDDSLNCVNHKKGCDDCKGKRKRLLTSF